MTSLIRNPLTLVWALLTAVTVVSWLVSRDGGAAHQLNATVTTVVLLIAAAKAQLVIWHFMEVRRAPVWLKAVTSGWVIAVFAAMLGVYFTGG
ncbi:cytochrome C oxidase subunit IV family protein [Mycobacterium sp. SA01]|uniref:cytochrome C oxidase subunit IV family protein n=1 Tax=Mycobacterium sp. SA01 TaxID=3238820 RepID=UPI00351B6468